MIDPTSLQNLEQLYDYLAKKKQSDLADMVIEILILADTDDGCLVQVPWSLEKALHSETCGFLGGHLNPPFFVGGFEYDDKFGGERFLHLTIEQTRDHLAAGL